MLVVRDVLLRPNPLASAWLLRRRCHSSLTARHLLCYVSSLIQIYHVCGIIFMSAVSCGANKCRNSFTCTYRSNLLHKSFFFIITKSLNLWHWKRLVSCLVLILKLNRLYSFCLTSSYVPPAAQMLPSFILSPPIAEVERSLFKESRGWSRHQSPPGPVAMSPGPFRRLLLRPSKKYVIAYKSTQLRQILKYTLGGSSNDLFLQNIFDE